MSRIVAFGCSHTYGLELPDCPTVHDPPSKFAFPNILANKLKLPVLNNSDTGASQRQIAATILETEIDNDDIVVINWSNPIRRGIWNGLHWNQLAPWTEDRIWKKYHAKYHFETDDILDSLMNINLANMFLKSKCKRIINTIHNYNKDIVASTTKWNNVKIELVFSDNNFYYKNLSGGHPDIKSHEVFAERLLEII